MGRCDVPAGVQAASSPPTDHDARRDAGDVGHVELREAGDHGGVGDAGGLGLRRELDDAVVDAPEGLAAPRELAFEMHDAGDVGGDLDVALVRRAELPDQRGETQPQAGWAAEHVVHRDRVDAQQAAEAGGEGGVVQLTGAGQALDQRRRLEDAGQRPGLVGDAHASLPLPPSAAIHAPPRHSSPR